MLLVLEPYTTILICNNLRKDTIGGGMEKKENAGYQSLQQGYCLSHWLPAFSPIPTMFRTLLHPKCIIPATSEFLSANSYTFNFFNNFKIFVVSSPEHEVLMVSSCDRPMSVVRHPQFL